MTYMNEIITRPGKFEGERRAVEVAYEKYLEGFHDEDDDGIVTVTLDDGEVVRWYEDSMGFINEIEKNT